MTSRVTTKLARAGEYAAEVEVELIDGTPDGRPTFQLGTLKSWMMFVRL